MRTVATPAAAAAANDRPPPPPTPPAPPPLLAAGDTRGTPAAAGDGCDEALDGEPGTATGGGGTPAATGIIAASARRATISACIASDMRCSRSSCARSWLISDAPGGCPGACVGCPACTSAVVAAVAPPPLDATPAPRADHRRAASPPPGLVLAGEEGDLFGLATSVPSGERVRPVKARRTRSLCRAFSASSASFSSSFSLSASAAAATAAANCTRDAAFATFAGAGAAEGAADGASGFRSSSSSSVFFVDLIDSSDAAVMIRPLRESAAPLAIRLSAPTAHEPRCHFRIAGGSPGGSGDGEPRCSDTPGSAGSSMGGGGRGAACEPSPPSHPAAAAAATRPSPLEAENAFEPRLHSLSLCSDQPPPPCASPPPPARTCAGSSAQTLP